MIENRNVYVGHRYVPKIMGEWNQSESYEGLSIVTHEGNSLTSKKRVPVGVDISNEEYWSITGNYNAQIEEYRQDVKRHGEDIATFKEDTTEQLAQIETNVKDFGAKGDGVTDDTMAINLAIENTRTGGRVNFPPGVYMVDGFDENAWNGQGVKGIKVRKPLTININGGATIKQISKSERNSRVYYGYLMFEVIGTHDVVFEGKGTIEGDRKEHIGAVGEYKGEHGTGIYINNSQNVVVRDLTIKHTWGDGIAIILGSKNVTVDNVIIDNVRRNGITIGSADTVNIINTTIKNVVGTMPQSGIDIEPNAGDGKANNVTISNCNFLNNAVQDIVFGGGDGCDNIFIDNCYFETKSFAVVSVGNNPNSTTVISNCFIRTKNSVFTVGGFKNTYINNISVESDFETGVQGIMTRVESNDFVPNVYTDGLKNINDFYIVFDVVGSNNKASLNITNSSFSRVGNSLVRASNKELQIVMKHNTINDSPLGTGGLVIENSVFDNNRFSDTSLNLAKLSNTQLTNNVFVLKNVPNIIYSRNFEDNIFSNNTIKVNLDYPTTIIDILLSTAVKDSGVVRTLPNVLVNNTIVSKTNANIMTELEDIKNNVVIKGGTLQ